MTALLLTIGSEDIDTILHVFVSYFMHISCTTDLWTYLTLHFHLCPEGEAVSRAALKRFMGVRYSLMSPVELESPAARVAIYGHRRVKLAPTSDSLKM